MTQDGTHRGVRLNKYLARAGVSSRRTADRFVEEGRVTVNGAVIRELGVRIDPVTDHVAVDGRAIGGPRGAFWGALHKPRGVVTTLRDPHGRRDLRGVLHGIPERVFPVGRLDYDSEGLLIITNDGDLAYRMAHPRFQVEKEYRVEVRGEIPPELTEQLVAGVELEDGRARAVRAECATRSRGGGVLLITLTEGRKREVRRMAEVCGLEVDRLLRIRVGGVRLGDLAPGSWRPLIGAEVEDLHRLVGLEERLASGLHPTLEPGGK